MKRSPLKVEILKRKRQVARAGRTSCGAADRLAAQESALWLLDHSLRRGHRKLSALRLASALEVGAPLSAEHWAACSDLLARPLVCPALRAALDKMPPLASGAV